MLSSTSLEAVDFQSDNTLYSELIKCVDIMIYHISEGKRGNSHYSFKYVKKIDFDEIIRESRITKVIQDHTNLKVRFFISPIKDINVAVSVPVIDPNSALTSSNNTELNKKYKILYDSIDRNRLGKEGAIDLKSAKVYGVYSEIDMPMLITLGLLEHDRFLSSYIAAFILHEIGHLMAYFERLGSIYTFNHVITDLIKEISGDNEKTKKVKLIHDINKTLDVKIPEEVADITNKENALIVLITSVTSLKISSSGAYAFDTSTLEASADQFAVRLGAGRDLAIALDLMERVHGYDMRKSSIKFYLWHIIKLYVLYVFYVISVAIYKPLIILVVLHLSYFFIREYIGASESIGGIYDKPVDRILRIKEDMQRELKNKNIDINRRIEIEGNLKMVNELLKGATHHMSFLAIWLSFASPYLYDSKVKKEFLQKIETLSVNNLFSSSNKFHIADSNKGYA